MEVIEIIKVILDCAIIVVGMIVVCEIFGNDNRFKY